MGSSRIARMPGMTYLALFLLLVTSAQGARIFRNPEPHLPAENLPVSSDQRGYTEIHSVSDPRSASEDDSFFAPGAWRPVRDPEFSSTGRRRVSSSATSGHAGELQVASSRNLRLDDGRSAGSNEGRTPPPSANSPTTTLGQSIALVANQLLQGSDIVESRTPEGSTTTSVNAGSWPQAPIDVRTPPKLMLQVHKHAENSDDEPGKKPAPIKDDPMGENFFPSRRHPPGVTQHVATTPGLTVTQMTVSTATSKQGEQKLPSSTTVVADKVKIDDKRPTTASFPVNRKSTTTFATTTTVSTPVTTPTTPTSVKWKIAIPPNRPTRFPPRKPVIVQTTTASPITSSNTSKKEAKPNNSGQTNFKPSTSSGGISRPTLFSAHSRQPTLTTTKSVTTSKPITTSSTLAIKKISSTPSSTTATTTSTTQPPTTTTSGPVITTTSHPTPSRPTKENPSNATVESPGRNETTAVLPKKPITVEKEILSESKVNEVTKIEDDSNIINKEESPSTTTPRPRRPSNKRKKNKNRRRRPSKKPSTSQASSGTELEVKETPQEENTGSAASPLSTRIYNFIAREVMPSMSVGLLGLVVTAGLAGYFLLPTLGGLQRRSDVTTDGLMTYGSGGAYGAQEDDGGIMTTIFQNVIASVRNGEKEFERGPRRKRNVKPTDETENEIDAVLHENSNNLGQKFLPMDTTTASYTTINTQYKDVMTEPSSGLDVTHTDQTTEGPVGNEGVTTIEADKDVNPTQDLIPSYWDPAYDENPFSLTGIFRRVVDFKLRIGVGLLRATTEVIARYLEDVQKRLRDSDRHEWLRSLGSTVRRIGRSIDSAMNADDNSMQTYPRKRYTRHIRT